MYGRYRLLAHSWGLGGKIGDRCRNIAHRIRCRIPTVKAGVRPQAGLSGEVTDASALCDSALFLIEHFSQSNLITLRSSRLRAPSGPSACPNALGATDALDNRFSFSASVDSRRWALLRLAQPPPRLLPLLERERLLALARRLQLLVEHRRLWLLPLGFRSRLLPAGR